MTIPLLHKSARILFPLVLVTLLAACATAPSTRISAADRAAIKTVKINPDVPMPVHMYYHGPGQTAAMVFGGAIGALLNRGAAQSYAEQIVDKLKETNISVPTILKDEFKRAATDRGVAFSEGGSSDAELFLSVNSYGLSQSHGFSALYPMMNVTAVLRKKDGSIAWQKTDFALPTNADNHDAYDFDMYMDDPELLRANMTVISSIVSKMLVNDLHKTQ